MSGENRDILELLVRSAEKSVAAGYYKVRPKQFVHRSLQEALRSSRNTPTITEIKFASPSAGAIRKVGDVGEIARAMERGGAAALSVLTEPEHFKGELGYLSRAKENVRIPVLMKDVIIDPVQIEAGKAAGADAILLIQSIFSSRYVGLESAELIDRAHELGLEVILEVHSARELEEAESSDADIIGINNRDLKSLKVSADTSASLLKGSKHAKLLLCESGLSSPQEARVLRALGADGFLVGTSIMRSADIESAVRAFTEGREQ